MYIYTLTQGNKMKNYTIAQLAYLAGIVDGEGSIYIGNFSSNPKTGNAYYQTNMEVTNTDESLISWLVDNFGGRSYAYTDKQTPKTSRKPVFRWIISGDSLTELCHLMLPYLIVKIRQCEIMIQMRKTFERKRASLGRQGTMPLEPEILAERKKLFDEMRTLHCRNYTNKP